MTSLLNWIKQPSSVAGISAFFGTVSAVLLQQLTWVQAVPILAGAIVSIVLPDNTAAKADAAALGQALMKKIRAD